jgi:hypothetical protein
VQQFQSLAIMLNLIESDVVGFAGLTARESVAAAGLTVNTVVMKKNKDILKNVDMIKPL